MWACLVGSVCAWPERMGSSWAGRQRAGAPTNTAEWKLRELAAFPAECIPRSTPRQVYCVPGRKPLPQAPPAPWAHLKQLQLEEEPQPLVGQALQLLLRLLNGVSGEGLVPVGDARRQCLLVNAHGHKQRPLGKQLQQPGGARNCFAEHAAAAWQRLRHAAQLLRAHREGPVRFWGACTPTRDAPKRAKRDRHLQLAQVQLLLLHRFQRPVHPPPMSPVEGARVLGDKPLQLGHLRGGGERGQAFVNVLQGATNGCFS